MVGAWRGGGWGTGRSTGGPKGKEDDGAVLGGRLVRYGAVDAEAVRALRDRAARGLRSERVHRRISAAVLRCRSLCVDRRVGARVLPRRGGGAELGLGHRAAEQRDGLAWGEVHQVGAGLDVADEEAAVAEASDARGELAGAALVESAGERDPVDDAASVGVGL